MNTCEFTHRTHDCSEPLACLRAAVSVPTSVDRDRLERDRDGFTPIWPDDPAWEVAA